jgi:hypothetical protein
VTAATNTRSGSTGALWSLGVFVAGVGISAALLGVSYWVTDGGQSVRVESLLWASALFCGPYTLCAVGLWLGRWVHRDRWALRAPALAVLVAALPSLWAAVYTAQEYSVRGQPYSILVHVWIAFLALLVQFPLAVVVVILGTVFRWRAPSEDGAQNDHENW